MTDLNRRRVLKGISATGLAVATPMSLMADKLVKKNKHNSVYVDATHKLPNRYASSELVNHSQHNVVLNSNQPFTYKDTDGDYTTVYLTSREQTVTLKAGERLPIYAKAQMAKRPEELNIKNKLADYGLSIV